MKRTKVQSPTKEEQKGKIIEQKRDIKILQQKLRRKDKRVEKMSKLISDLKERNLVNKDTACIINESFSGLGLL